MPWGEKNRKINNRVGGTIIRDSRVIEKEKKTLWPFLWMGFNCLKASVTSTRQFIFYH